ncbi:MAG: ribulose-phosphate 3-epimerase [Pirellulales bacterium]
METWLAGSSQWTLRFDASTLVVDTHAATPRRAQFAALRAYAPVVVPSLLLCDFAHLADEIHRLEEAGVHSFHLDVMDGHFVPNLTYGLPIVEAVRRETDLPIETHLMISNPQQFIEQFVQAGADAVTFHYEAVDDPRPVLRQLRSLGAIAGLAYNPDTPLEAISEYLPDCDLVLTMSVHPGFGGQSFEPIALDKLRQLSERVGDEIFLEVDGGVNATTIARCAAAGAQLHVVGSAIFDQPDYPTTVAALNRLARNPTGLH